MKIFILLLLICISSGRIIADSKTDSLRNEIKSLIDNKKAQVGVAVLDMNTGDTMTLNNKRYPMQSVFKFHLSLAVLDAVDKGRFYLEQPFSLKEKDLLSDTWSPIKKKFPKGDAYLTLKEIIQYTAGESDNNGCDFLFKLIGGPEKVNKYIHNLGVKDVSIKADEREMHLDWNIQFINWSTPYAAVQLLEKFGGRKILSDSSFAFLWNVMVNSPTGADRIKALLPQVAKVAHKTGSSGKNDKGLTAALNDIGFIVFPDGSKVALAVFITNSKETEAENAKIIAKIGKMVWDFYTVK